jgi:hypothetical protein
MPKILRFNFCLISLYDTYLVTNINEGVNLKPEHNKVLDELATSHFKGRPFVYITHRIHSYSVDPKIYFETSKIPNLVGFAVVSSVYKAKSNAEVERMFFSKPFEIFNDLESAQAWADRIVKNHQD